MGNTGIDMRIRKHSGTLIAPLERPKRSTSCIAISNGHGLNGGDERFLLPLVAAVIDVQQAEDKEGGGDHGTHTRPTPNWRNALHQQSCSEGNSKSQDLQVSVRSHPICFVYFSYLI